MTWQNEIIQNLQCPMKSFTGFSNLSNHAFALFYHVWQCAHLDRKSIYLLPGDPKSTPVLSSINAQEKMNFQNKTVLNYQWVNLSLDILVKILSCHLSKIWMFKVRQVFWKLSEMRRKWLINVSEEPGMMNTTPDNRRSLRQLITEKFSWNQGSKFSFENKLIRAFYTHHKLYNFYQNWLTAENE